jgi:hypothetical protein
MPASSRDPCVQGRAGAAGQFLGRVWIQNAPEVVIGLEKWFRGPKTGEGRRLRDATGDALTLAVGSSKNFKGKV